MNKVEIFYDAIMKDWTVKTYIDDMLSKSYSVGEKEGMDFIYLLTKSMIEVRNSEKQIFESK